MPNVGGKKRGK